MTRRTARGAGTPPAAPPPHGALLVTDAGALLEEVRSLAAATGVALHHVRQPAEAGTAWHRAPLVLLGEDAAAMPLPSVRHDLVLVTGGGDASAWALAAAVGAARVVVLPDARGQLLEMFAAVMTPGARGRVVGFLGGCGGAGASTLALATGLAAVWLGLRAVVVDADPLGGGLDVLAGAEGRQGLRWPDLVAARGSVRPDVLRDGLPDVDGLGLLSWDRSRTATSGVLDADVARVVLGAAAAGHDMVAVDLPRGSGPADTALWRLLDAVVLLVPAQVRAVLGAARLVDQVRDSVAAVHLVVGTVRASALSPSVVADALELPVTTTWPDDDRLPAAAERSDIAAALWRRGHRGRCEELLAEVLDLDVGSAGGTRRGAG